jgi:hypothetical protein
MDSTPQYGGHFNSVDGSPPCHNANLAAGSTCQMQVQMSGGQATGTYAIPIAQSGGTIVYVLVTVY